MAVDPGFADHVTDLFSGLGPIRRGRIFGGMALYAGAGMFAMISAEGRVFLKADASTRPAFEAAGSTPFTYRRGDGLREIASLMELPESALEDPVEALGWARLALPVAEAAAAARAARPASRPTTCPTRRKNSRK